MQPSESIRYYDYYSAPERFAGAAPSELESAQTLAPWVSFLTPQAKVVDLGCGWGQDARVLASRGFRVLGLDASGASIERAQQASNDLAEHLRFEVRNVLFWSPESESWDGVWISRTLQHFSADEAQRVIAIAFRALKAGGVLGIVVPEGQGRYEEKGPDLLGPSRFIHLYSEKQMCSMLEQTGFKDLKVARRVDLEKTKGPELMVLARRI